MLVNVDIYINRIMLSWAQHLETVLPEQPFSTQRLLIGNFSAAEACLQQALKKHQLLTWYKLKPKLIITAKALNQGGLSEVEQRCLYELGYSAGGRQIEVRHN